MNLTNAVSAANAIASSARAEQWATRPGECDESKVPYTHWVYAILCTPCAAASAKATMDQSNVVFNVLCVPPPMAYSYLRLGYNLQGTWKDDCVNGVLCFPCGTRQAYTESLKRGQVPGRHGQLSQQWSSSLLQCDDVQEFAKATLCPCVVAHDVRTMLQPTASPFFDIPCLMPTAWYGIVRNTYGIATEWPHPALEDVAVGLFLYPCALNRALREAAYQKTVHATNAVAGVIGSAQAKVQQLGTKALAGLGQLGKTAAPPQPGTMQ